MIGIFGGAFNPIHTGHLILAEFIRDEFSLDKVVFIPAGKPPHKQAVELEQAKHRYRMVQLAIANNPFFEVSGLELNREGITYTSDTLKECSKLYPGKHLYFICGADSINNFPTWHHIDEIFSLATLIVAGRPNTPQVVYENLVQSFKIQYNAKILQSEVPLLEVSSTHIRDRVNQGLSIRYMVPDEVLNHIQLYKLYQ